MCCIGQSVRHLVSNQGVESVILTTYIGSKLFKTIIGRRINWHSVRTIVPIDHKLFGLVIDRDRYSFANESLKRITRELRNFVKSENTLYVFIVKATKLYKI